MSVVGKEKEEGRGKGGEEDRGEGNEKEKECTDSSHSITIDDG